jgi:P27 family predicted phage terminase small subunit
MTAGRPRKPTALKLVTGTLRPDRFNSREPQPKRKRPVMPATLSAGAKKAWRQFAKLLDELGVLTTADTAALGNLCEAAADLETARAALAARPGLTYENVTAAGGVTHRAYPEVALVRDAERRVHRWLAAFGLTPADRSKVSIADVGKDEDPAAKFLR